MNKWIMLVATLLISLGFFTTIGTTMSNPSLTNVLISIALLIVGVLGFISYLKISKKQEDEFEPVED